MHALNGIRTHDLRVRASEDSSCFRPRGYCDRPTSLVPRINEIWYSNIFRAEVSQTRNEQKKKKKKNKKKKKKIID
jgi:hypothetical protein